MALFKLETTNPFMFAFIAVLLLVVLAAGASASLSLSMHYGWLIDTFGLNIEYFLIFIMSGLLSILFCACTTYVAYNQFAYGVYEDFFYATVKVIKRVFLG